jgi:hypothetical protein
MTYKYIVCIETDHNEINPDYLIDGCHKVIKVYHPIEDENQFLTDQENAQLAVIDREAFYQDLNRIFMSVIKSLQKQGLVTESGEIDKEGYTTQAIIHFGLKMGAMVLDKLTSSADKNKAEYKEAITAIKKGKTPDGNVLTEEGELHYQTIIDNYSEPVLDKMVVGIIKGSLSTIGMMVDRKGKEFNIDFEVLMEDMKESGEVLGKWGAKAAMESPEMMNFLVQAKMVNPALLEEKAKQ